MPTYICTREWCEKNPETSCECVGEGEEFVGLQWLEVEESGSGYGCDLTSHEETLKRLIELLAYLNS